MSVLINRRSLLKKVRSPILASFRQLGFKSTGTDYMRVENELIQSITIEASGFSGRSSIEIDLVLRIYSSSLFKKIYLVPKDNYLAYAQIVVSLGELANRGVWEFSSEEEAEIVGRSVSNVLESVGEAFMGSIVSEEDVVLRALEPKMSITAQELRLWEAKVFFGEATLKDRPYGDSFRNKTFRIQSQDSLRQGLNTTGSDSDFKDGEQFRALKAEILNLARPNKGDVDFYEESRQFLIRKGREPF